MQVDWGEAEGAAPNVSWSPAPELRMVRLRGIADQAERHPPWPWDEIPARCEAVGNRREGRLIAILRTF